MPASVLEQMLRRGARAYAKLVFGRQSKLALLALPGLNEPLPAAPIPGDWIEAGTPEASSRILVSSGDGGLAAGVWHCTAGTFRWYFECDELIYVLSGAVEIEHEGKRQRLGPGDLGYFPLGAITRWSVDDHVRKLFVHRHPTPLTRKTLGLA